MRKEIINGVVILSVLFTAALSAAEFEDIEMGEVDGYNYTARSVRVAVGGILVGEVVREKPGMTRKVSEFRLPIASEYADYYAGVSPNGDYFYLAGEIAPDGRGEDDPDDFLYVYSLTSPDDPLVEYSCAEYDPWHRDFLFYGDTLYMIIGEWSFDILYKINIGTGAITKVVEEANIVSVHPDEGYCIVWERYQVEDEYEYRSKLEDFGIDCGYLVQPNRSCICHPSGGYLKYLRVDLASGEVTELCEVSATSTLIEEGKPTDYLGANKTIDCDISTAWVEGVDGPGVGETLTVNFVRDIGIVNVGILSGFVKSPQVYLGNNRLKKARLDFSDGTSFDVEFEDKAELKILTISDYARGIEKITASWMSITILDVYPGNRWDDTCISEVTWNIEFGDM